MKKGISSPFEKDRKESRRKKKKRKKTGKEEEKQNEAGSCRSLGVHVSKGFILLLLSNIQTNCSTSWLGVVSCEDEAADEVGVVYGCNAVAAEGNRGPLSTSSTVAVPNRQPKMSLAITNWSVVVTLPARREDWGCEVEGQNGCCATSQAFSLLFCEVKKVAMKWICNGIFLPLQQHSICTEFSTKHQWSEIQSHWSTFHFIFTSSSIKQTCP